MNDIKISPLINLGREAHFYAQELASRYTIPQKRQRVYLNILTVYAVYRYLKRLQIETDLEQGDSWNSNMQALFDVADLVLPNIGKLECCPVLPGETAIDLSLKPTQDDLIGYVAVQFSDDLSQVELLGFIPAVRGEYPPETINLAELKSREVLIDYITEREAEVLRSKLSTEKSTDVSKWLLKEFDELWEAVENVLTPRQLALRSGELAWAVRSISKTERAKKIDLGLRLNGQKVTLVISIWPEENQELGVLVQVHPIGEEYLPLGLKLKVTLESASREVEAREADNWIQLEFTELPGKAVTVQVAFEERAVTEKFVI